MNLTATYSPEDNKLRLYSILRLDSEMYSRLKAAGFKWAPRQQLFVAPMWTPQRADLLMEFCGEIGDEDKSLVKRAEERAERFENFSENRAKDAERARKNVDAIVEHIPFGQPILFGHHSERRARKDAQRIDDGRRKSIKMWDTSNYWTARAEAAIQHAKYKELPAVRARRIKGLESDERKYAKYLKNFEFGLRAWSTEGLTKDQALIVARHSDFTMPRKEGDRPDFNGNPSARDALSGSYPNLYAPRTVEEVVKRALVHHQSSIRWAQRWLEHTQNRLTYERAMLTADGGIVADKKGPQVGGACKCWASPRGGWSVIQKVNKVSVTVLDNWGNGGRDFTRTIPFDKLHAIMSKAEVDSARQAGLIRQESSRGFFLLPAPSQNVGETAIFEPETAHILPTPAVSTGIQTPRGPIVGSPSLPQTVNRSESRQGRKPGIHL